MQKTILTTLTALALSVPALAQDTTTRGRLSSESVSLIPRDAWVPYLGLGAGYTSADTNANFSEGLPSQLKLLASYYSADGRGVYDLGYGISNQQFSRTGAVERAVTGAQAEIAARYQRDDRWQAGVIAAALLGQGRAYEAEQGDAHFAGLQALKEFDMGRGAIGRLGGRLMTDLNVPGQTVTMAMIDFQMGWNPAARKQSVSQAAARSETTTRNGRPLTMTEQRPAGAIELVTAEFAGRPGYIFFESNRAGIRAPDRQRLARLARALEDRSDLFESIEVLGYSDATGSDSLNQELSERRAQQVRDYLVSAGWPTDRIAAQGQGVSRSLASTGSGVDADSRRAEIHFHGVKDAAQLRQILAEVE
ncbi:MAG: OmpA family protein [Bdellovibrionaceae bacterium]|nr:OmpA family protein [Pseudobdellovibrionaceae bacterium]